MVLDAQSVEYIHQLSPSVGFTISLSDREDNVQDQWMLVSPGLHSVVSVNKVTIGHFLPISSSTMRFFLQNTQHALN